MNWQDQLEHDRQFLYEQMIQLASKIARLENARATCRDSLEAEGIDRLLHAARLEKATLADLIDSQLREDAPPLSGLIMAEVDRYKAEARKQAANWRRGQPTPPAYWDAEARQGILTDLLRRLHAWRAGRPYYAEAGRSGPAHQNGVGVTVPKPAHARKHEIHPWYVSSPGGSSGGIRVPPGTHANGSAVDILRARLYAALHNAGFPDEHVEILVQSDGLVIVTGYAHDDEQAENAIQMMAGFPGVWRVLADIKVTSPQNCPACRAQEQPRAPITRESRRRLESETD